MRKGGDLLLDVFRTRFQDCAELHLVSRQAPNKLPPHVHVHADFHPNDERLTELYAQADLLVVPTLADISPWVFLEAMAMGLPVIGTDTGAIREFIHHGKTGFVIAVGDGAALGAVIETLRREAADPAPHGPRGPCAGRSRRQREPKRPTHPGDNEASRRRTKSGAAGRTS